jgi:TfoX/Sxy family transcriptional regulator of competence genes
MPYNEEIDARIKQIVSKKGWKKTDNKKMFGGVCHLLKGNMFCGVHKESLILRLGEENAKDALALPFVRPFDITGRPMKGWVMVEREGFDTSDKLEKWLNQAKEFAGTLPSSI